MIPFLILLHLLGLAFGLGGMVCQLLLLGRFHHSPDPQERIGSERMAAAAIMAVQAPGVYLSILTGIALTWAFQWRMLSQGWLQFKLLFVFWILLATRLMARNAENIRLLREQCGDEDTERLKSLKLNHRMIGYVTVLTFLFVITLSLWKPF